jgi:hypothetical protein
MGGGAVVNGSGDTYILEMFKRAPGFFDIVTYVGTGSATTFNHNLGAVPSVVLVKGRDAGYNWYWQHYALGANTWLELNSNGTSAGNGNIFNDTLPTSSVFSVGSLDGTNASGSKYIAYLFGDLPGVSKAGTYTGNGGAQTIDCGFTNGARFVLIKAVDVVNDWRLFDTVRGIGVGNDPVISLNTSAAQDPNKNWLEADSSGFRLNTSDDNVNQNTKSYIFLAIA